MLKKHPIITRLLIFIILPSLIVLYWVYYYIEASNFIYTEHKEIEGIEEIVTVFIDEVGSPSIYAESDKDAYFMQGYLHASERMWQMEFQRKLIQGRLSELFGKRTVSSDIWMRTLGLYSAAEKALKNMNPTTLAALDAYASGVNTWINETKIYPPEFLYFGHKPSTWNAVDSIAWQKAFALNLGKNMFDEFNRIAALKKITPKQLKTFYIYDPDLNTSKTNLNQDNIDLDSKYNKTFSNASKLQSYLLDTWKIGDRLAGSNAWVVSGKYTKNKLPILANDPHLSIQKPSLWYPMQMSGSKLNASGMSLIGLPGIFLGSNESISWGVTALMSDQQDLFLLDIPLNDNNKYKTEEGLKPIFSKEEIINIRTESPEILNKDIEPIKIIVRSTDLGPIITDVIGNTNYPMSLRWSSLDDIDNSYQAFFEIQYAKDWEQFRQAIKDLKSPGLNFLYADLNGNIGSQVGGSIPRRLNNKGVIPTSAYLTKDYWSGYISFDKLPMQFNPNRGFIVSANNKIPSQEGVVISHEWASDIRFNRIKQLIEKNISEGHKFDIKLMHSIQLDQLDVGAKKLHSLLNQPNIIEYIKGNASKKNIDLVNRSIDEIEKWSGYYSLESSGATIYFYWKEKLKEKIFLDNLDMYWSKNKNSHLNASLIGLVEEKQLIDILTEDVNNWCSSEIQYGIHCLEELTISFYEAVEQIRKDSGTDDVFEWSWGKMHKIEYSHQPFGRIKFLDKFFKNTLPSGGSRNTINVANASPNVSGGYLQTFGPSFRQIFDFNSKNNGYYMLSGGQSGHFLNENYSRDEKSFNKKFGLLHEYDKEKNERHSIFIPKDGARK